MSNFNPPIMKRIFWLLPTILLFTACESFEELSVDPNRSSEVNPGLLLTNIMVDAHTKSPE